MHAQENLATIAFVALHNRGVSVTLGSGGGRTHQFSVRASRFAVRTRTDVVFALLDVVLIAGAYVAVLLMRFDGYIPGGRWVKLAHFLPIAVAVHLAWNVVCRIYGQLWRYASVDEARRLLLAGALSGATLLAFVVTTEAGMPLSVVTIGGLVAVVAMGALRFQSRLFAFHRRGDDRPGLRVVVIGAGTSGATVVRQMLSDRAAGYVPVAFLDDNRRKQGCIVHGIAVVGPINDLSEVVERFDVNHAVLAIPSASQGTILRASRAADEAGVPLRVLPGVADVIAGPVSLQNLRDLNIEDLLGREQVPNDRDSVRNVVAGKRVLITGAGGSIGSEIVRQVKALGPRRTAAGRSRRDPPARHRDRTAVRVVPDAPGHP